MSKFMISVSSPDGATTKEEIEEAMNWMINHDGKAWRASITVTEIERDYRLPKLEKSNGNA